MHSKKQRLILSFVSLTIVVTIAVQIYWNFINYQSNKSELVNQVQISLDKAIEAYYADIARGHSMTITASPDSLSNMNQFKHIIQKSGINLLDSTEHREIFRFGTHSGQAIADTIISFEAGKWSTETAIQIERSDSLHINQIDTSAISLFASKIFVSMKNDTLNFNAISDLVKDDFDNKNWPINFGLLFRDPDCMLQFIDCDTVQVFGQINQNEQLMASSQSALIPGNSSLEIYFSNISTILLQRSFIGIFLSLLLAASIIFCLLYLIKIINQQKQLSEIKNDLISNITHEFKTPITTIGTALEGIENFSGLQDIDRTKKYIGISNGQLNKLNTMVEKLLETASIDSEHLELNLSQVDINELISQQLDKYKFSYEDKSFDFTSDGESVSCKVDAFHIEGVIGNLIDNAIKYGGDQIKIALSVISESFISIEVIDSGSGIAKDQRAKIFDKFYRIPTGNIHDVKGFGIGLYYAKNIVEKHNGQLELMASPVSTNFKITLPYAN